MIRNRFLKTIIISILSLLVSTHILAIFEKGISLNNITILLVAVFIYGVIKEVSLIYSITLILVGTFSTLTLPELTEISPFIFFFLALYFLKYRKYGLIFIPLLLILGYLGSYMLNDFDNPINLIEGIMGNLFLFFLFNFIFLQQTGSIIKLSRTTPLNKRQLLILRQLSKDIPRKQIPDSVKESELWSLDLEKKKFTLDIINTDIAKIKQKLEIKGDFALALWYKEKIEIIKEDNK